MTAHLCTTLQAPGLCFRCDLNRDEMGHQVEITIRWTEKAEHSSTITLDEDDFLIWLNEGAEEGTPRRGMSEATADEVRDYFLAGDEEDWLTPAKEDKDWLMSDYRLVEVELP